jgi:1,4-alpha-glucan branching enzyme
MTRRQTARVEKKPATRRCKFTLDAPEAKRVVVTGSFCGWLTDGHELKKNKAGLWETTLPLVPGRHEYRFLVDGVWRNDPTCTELVANPFGTENCVVNL